MNPMHSYSKIYNLGHPEAAALFLDSVTVQEKVDGSQFSWMMEADGTVHFRSKGSIIYPETKDKLFRGSIDHILEQRDKLVVGYVYRGEALCRPKHNTLEYGRAPNGFIVLFDVDRNGEQTYASPEVVQEIGFQLDVDVAPTYYEGIISNADELLKFFERESVLGGKIEGVVIKNYVRWAIDKKVLMGKHVRAEFKEAHTTAWKSANPTRADVVDTIGADLRTDARFQKAVQHLRDAGTLTSSPKDIGALLAELKTDLKNEMSAEVAQRLLTHFWPHILRIATSGFPEWYKNELLKAQFTPEHSLVTTS